MMLLDSLQLLIQPKVHRPGSCGHVACCLIESETTQIAHHRTIKCTTLFQCLQGLVVAPGNHHLDIGKADIFERLPIQCAPLETHICNVMKP